MKVTCTHCNGRGAYTKCDVCGVEYSYIMELPHDLKPLMLSTIDLCTSCMDTFARARAEAVNSKPKDTEEFENLFQKGDTLPFKKDMKA